MTIYWTNEALTDVAEIREYLLNSVPEHAERIVESFFDRVQQVGDFPKMGRLYRQGELPQVREILVSNYRITYYVGLSQLDIMTVRHQAQKR